MQYFTLDKTGLAIRQNASVSLFLLPGEEQPNEPKPCYGISFRQVATLTEAPKELATGSELESKVVFCPGLGPFLEFDLQKDDQTC